MRYIRNYKIFESTQHEYSFCAESWGDVEDAKAASEYLADKFKSYDTTNPEIKNYAYVVYKVNDFILAACEYGHHTGNKESEVYIHINFIYTDIKNAGIASSMIEEIIEGYPDIQKFRCYVRKSNIPSLHMFQKLGFQIVDEMKWENGDETSHVLEFNR